MSQLVTNELEINEAFLRDLTVDGPEAGSKDVVKLHFAVVPKHIQVKGAGGSPGAPATTPMLLQSNFRVTISGINGSRIAAVQGLHASWPKVLQPAVGTRRAFLQGLPIFDDLQIGIGLGSGTTAADLEQWVSQVALGTATPRNGVIEFLDPGRTVVSRQVNLFDLFPTSFLPFPGPSNRRTITMTLGRFSFQ